MKVKATTKDEVFVIELATFDSMTEQQQFQQFLSHFRTSGWYQINDIVAISFNSVEKVEILQEAKRVH